MKRCFKCKRILRNRDEVAQHSVFTKAGIGHCKQCAEHTKEDKVYMKKKYHRRKDIVYWQRSIADGKRMVRCV